MGQANGEGYQSSTIELARAAYPDSHTRLTCKDNSLLGVKIEAKLEQGMVESLTPVITIKEGWHA